MYVFFIFRCVKLSRNNFSLMIMSFQKNRQTNKIIFNIHSKNWEWIFVLQIFIKKILQEILSQLLITKSIQIFEIQAQFVNFEKTPGGLPGKCPLTNSFLTNILGKFQKTNIVDFRTGFVFLDKIRHLLNFETRALLSVKITFRRF